MEKIQLGGHFKAILREKVVGDDPRNPTGRIIKESPWTQNNITNIWKLRALMGAKMAGNPATALRSDSRPATGQYAALIGTGNWGIYVMGANITVGSNDVIPPFVTARQNELAANVVYRNVNNQLVEDANTLISVDNRSRYSYNAADPFFEVRYVKNIGAATITGLCFGRDWANPSAHTGILLGEYAPTTSTVGTTNYFLEHREDRSIVWKTVSAANQFSFDLRSKQMVQFTSAELNTNIANVALTGGLVIGNTVVKATTQSSTAGSVVIRLTGCSNFTQVTNTSFLDVAFPGTDLNTARIVRPILVARPDMNAFEVFVPMNISNGQVQIQRAVITNFQGGIDSATVGPIQNFAVSQYVIGADDAVTAARQVTGYFHVEAQRYYFPYRQLVLGDNTLAPVSDANYHPGVIVDDTMQLQGLRHYLCRTDGNFNAPVMTDAGVLYNRVNTTTMYYFQGTGVISGANFSEPFIKDENTVLELIYRYSMN